MDDRGGLLGILSDENTRPEDNLSNVIEARNTGVLPYQKIAAMVRAHDIKSLAEIEPNQIQPASLDLRLGRCAYRVRASFLPGQDAAVMDKIKQLDGEPAIDLEQGATLESGAVYVVELQESVTLNADTFGIANPKSSTGRLDVLTRLITDNGTAFDHVKKGYSGKLYIEIAPLSFSIIVRSGIRLNQIRFHRDRGATGGSLGQAETSKLYDQGQLLRSPAALLPLRDGTLVPVTVDLEGGGRGTIIGYRAKKNANRIDVGRINHYDPREFWDKLESGDGRLNLDEGAFYILASREEIGVPRRTAAEMVPYDSRSGEFRVHYAGFFDPGFGWANEQAGGSRAVLEVRSYGVPFTLEHGQIVGWLRYAPIAGGYTERVYGAAAMQSHYQGQGVALAKQFRPWPL
jgi:dCTP deaminase